MSVYYRINDDSNNFLASNRGWGDVCRWIDTLDAGTYPQTVILREHGWGQEGAALAKELQAALQSHHPQDTDTADVIADLLEVAEGMSEEDAISINDSSPEEPSDTNADDR